MTTISYPTRMREAILQSAARAHVSWIGVPGNWNYSDYAYPEVLVDFFNAIFRFGGYAVY